MGKGQNLLRHMLSSAELPGELLPGTPLMELIGSSRFLLENHRGVTEYTQERIQVRVCGGIVSVSGRCLTIAQMTAKQLIITGHIALVELQGRCCP